MPCRARIWLYAAGKHLAHHRVAEPAPGRACRAQAEERRRTLRIGHHHGQADGEHRYVQRLGDELLCVQGSVTDEGVERPLPPDVHQVFEVVFDLADEELVKVERDQLGAPEAGSFGEQVVEVACHHLGGLLVREPGHAQSVELGAVCRSGVPPHIVTAVGEVDGDPC